MIDVGEELSSHDWLLCDVGDWDLVTVCLDVDCLLLEFEVLDDVSVLEADGGLNFFPNELQELLVVAFFSKIKDLQGV